MKAKLMMICLGLVLFSCKDQKEAEAEDDMTETSGSYEMDGVEDSDRDEEYSTNRVTSGEYEENDSIEKPTNSASGENVALSGTFIKDDHTDDTDCSCYCINVANSGNGELCLREGELYINSRFSQSGNDINIYYTGKSSKTNDKEIPWDKFETGTPIAVISPSGDGFKLDWKGFSIDGDIAMDYAILGKKTLEGTYKRK